MYFKHPRFFDQAGCFVIAMADHSGMSMYQGCQRACVIGVSSVTARRLQEKQAVSCRWSRSPVQARWI